MKKPLWRIAVLVLLLLSIGLPSWASPQSALQSHRRKLERIQRELITKRAHAQRLKRAEKAAASQLYGIQQKLEVTSGQLEDSRFRLTRAESQLGQTRRMLERAQADFQQQQGLTSNRLRAIYKHRHVNYWEALLTSEDLPKFLSRYKYFKRISAQDARLLHSLETKMSEIDRQKRQYATQRQQIAMITEGIETQKVQLEDQTAQQATLVQRLKTERKLYEQMIDQLERDSNQIEYAIRRIIAELNRKRRRGVRLGTGRFMVPASGPVTSPFGRRYHPILQTYRAHMGIDLGSPYGSAIVAADDGVVIFSGWYGGYGKMVWLDHGGDLVSLYGHASSLLVSTGQRVRRGQVIARVGSTGLSTGPHLHFEIRRNGTPVNPMGYLR